MPIAIEQQPWWNDVLANLKSRKLRDLAREHKVPVAELQQALERTGHLGPPPGGGTPAPAARAPSGRASRTARTQQAPAAAPAAPPAPAPAAEPAGTGRANDRIEALRDLLGKIPDGEIAKRANVARKTVVEYRKRHGIDRYRGAAEEGEGEESTPAAAPAAEPEVAAAPAAPEATDEAPARSRRSRKAAAAPEPAPAPAAPVAQTGRASKLDAFLDIVGTIPDREVAERSGMTTENVRMYRLRRGIPARWRGEGAPRTATRGKAARAAAVAVTAPPVVEAAPTPEVAPVEAPAASVEAPAPSAPRRGRPPGAVVGGTKVDRALEPYRDQIGQVPDAEIATKAGVSRSAVSAFRQRNGIAASGRPARPPEAAPAPVSAPAAARAPEAQAPTPAPIAPAPAVVARIHAPPAEAPASPAAAITYAYRIVATRGGERRAFGLIAPDPVEAVRRAHEALTRKALDWVIQSVRLVGEGLPE